MEEFSPFFYFFFSFEQKMSKSPKFQGCKYVAFLKQSHTEKMHLLLFYYET